MLVTARALASDPDRDGRVAVRDGAAALSYAELRERARAFADAGRGWPAPDAAGACVGVLAPWTGEFVAAFCGLASSGWAVGVLDPAWSDEELTGALEQLEPSVVLVADECASAAAALTPRGWRERSSPLSERGWLVLSRERASPARGAADVSPEAAFYVGFTSGSSGRPKAFMRSHRSWWASFESLDAVCPVDQRGAVLVPGPLSSSHFLFGVMHALHVGATVELTGAVERLTPRLTEPGVISALYVVPTMLARLAEDSPPAGDGPRHIMCAGARLDLALRRRTAVRFPRSTVVEYYGASELSFVAIRVDGDDTPEGTVGRPFPGVEIRILDDADRDVPAGESGTIFARSKLMFMGYRGVPPVGGARAIGGGWLTVGDRGSLDPFGYLAVEGRGSSLIITGGANVQPEEVEEAVARHDSVGSCVVVGLPDARWGEIVCAVVTLVGEHRPDRSDLRRHVATVLAPYKRPRRYLALDGPLPLGRTGKVDRERIADLVRTGTSVRDLR